ncbi:Ral GTPase-activating protein subunit alpha-1 [Globomyces sp. JEL0801]|nr:Ral GTPase-activating protein subunit alpha-1 [Globomyces sp. JEL0801]
MSEELLQDLEKLDQLPDRECYSFCVLYRYTTDIIEDIFKPADCANHEFNSFLWSLGWQVELKTHLGFKGNFTFDKIPLVPYFGNLNTEVIFISPELIRNEPQKMNTKMQIKKANSISNKDSTKSKGLERKATLSSDRISNSNQTNNQSKGKDKSRSRSKTMNTQVEMTKSDFECKIENDIVCVVWTDDILNLNCYIEDLPPNLLVAIGVGPLAHDIIVGKSNLGALVRQTAVNIHKSYNISKCIYKRPALIRRQLIEEICNRNMNSNNGLMTEILTQ